jgi:hypothetical protein
MPTRPSPTDPAGAPDEPPALALEALDREGVTPSSVASSGMRRTTGLQSCVALVVPAMPDTWVVSTSRFAARIVILLGTQP